MSPPILLLLAKGGVVLPPYVPIDPGTPATVSSITSPSAAEGGTLVFNVVLNAASDVSSPLTYTVTGTAAGADIGSPTFGIGASLAGATVTVLPGITSFTVSYPVTDDAGSEGAETVILTIGGVVGVGTIAASDQPSTVVSVSSPTVVEGVTLVYTVTLSAAATVSSPLTYSASGTAGAGDIGSHIFSAGVTLAGATLTVPSGVSSFTVSIPTVDDSDVEADETVVLIIGGISGSGTITNNDTATPSFGLVEGFGSLAAEPNDWLQQVHNSTLDNRSQLPPLQPYHGYQVGLKRPWFHWPRINGATSSADDAKTYTVEVRRQDTGASICSMTILAWTYVRATADLPLGTWCQWRVNDPSGGWSGWRDFFVRADAIDYTAPTRTGAHAVAAAKSRPRFALSPAQITAYQSGDQVVSFNRMKVLFDNNGAGGGGSFEGGALPTNTPSTAVALLEHTRIVICHHLWQITGDVQYRTEGVRRFANLLTFSAANIAEMNYADTIRINDITFAIAYDAWQDQLTSPQRTAFYDLAGTSLNERITYPIMSTTLASPLGRRWWDIALFAGHIQNHALTAACLATAIAGDEALFTGSHSNLAANIATFMEAVEVLQGEFEFKGTDDGGYRGGPVYAASQHLFVSASDAMASCFGTNFWEHPKRFQLERMKALLYPRSTTRYDGFGDDNQVVWGVTRMYLGWRARAQEMHELIESSGLAMDDGQYYCQPLFWRSAAAAPARGVPSRLTNWVLSSGEWASHSDWASTTRTSIFARSDPAGSWNHSNLRNNCLIIKVGGQPVAVDGGRYDEFNTTHQFNFRGLPHKAGNCVSLNSRAGGQQGWQGSNLSRSTRARFIKVQDGGNWGAFVSDATASYQAPGYEHSKAIRRLFHLRPGLILIVDDHALTGAAQPFEVNWHTENLHSVSGITVSGSNITGTVVAGHGVPTTGTVAALVSSPRQKLTGASVTSNVATLTVSGGHKLPLGSAVPVILTPIAGSGWPAGLSGYFTANVSNSTALTVPTSGIADNPAITIPALNEPGVEFLIQGTATQASGTAFSVAFSGATISAQSLAGTYYVQFGPHSAGATSPLTLSQGTQQIVITPLSGTGLTTPTAQLLNDFSWGGANNTQLYAAFCNASVHKFGQQHWQSAVLQQNHAYTQYPSGTAMLAASYAVCTGQTTPSAMTCSATVSEVNFTFSIGGTSYAVTLNRADGEWSYLAI